MALVSVGSDGGLLDLLRRFFGFGGFWKRKPVSVAENGNGNRFPFRSLPPSKSLSVVNSEKNYPAKKMQVDLPVGDSRGEIYPRV